MITVNDILHGKSYTELTWGQVLNRAGKLAVEQQETLVMVKPGIEISDSTMTELSRRALAGHILTPTVIDPGNSRIELTHHLAAGFPDLKYTMGSHEPGMGMEHQTCFDHGIIAVSAAALVEVGAFDPGFTEYLCICDWTVRARWHGYTVELAHDLTVTAANPPVFTAVYRDREQAVALLDRTHFERKWGGSVLRNLMQ